MAKRLYTEADVRELPAGAELVLGKEAIATPAALEAAHARGVRVRWGGPGPAAAPTDGGLKQLLSEEGEYVVQVKGGRVRVFRLAASGPVFVGEGS